VTDRPHPSIRDKVVLLTGATSPVGRALVRRFLDAGARLALCVRRAESLIDIEPMLAGRAADTMIVPCDLRREENVVRMVHRVAQCFGRIDVAVNAASISGPKLGIVEYPAEPWCNVTDTNLHGTYFVCREVLPWMIRQHTGSIINITSALTTTSQAQGGACAVSQHAIEGLTKVLASELRDSGVRVNTVDIDEPTSHPGTAQADSGWTNAFLWLAGDESAARNGEHIRAADFARRA